MRRMLGLELKRLFKARMVRILLAASLVLAVGMAMLVVSFTEYYYLDEQGNQARVTGFTAVREWKKTLKPYEGDLTAERIARIVKENRVLEEKYGEDTPLKEYMEIEYPTGWALALVRQVFVEHDGSPTPLTEITDREAANFYKQREQTIAAELAAKYPERLSVQKKAAALNEKLQTPLHFVYGYAKSDAGDYLLMCLILLSFFCAVLAAPVFSADYQNGADDILRCTKNGRLRLAFTKMLAVMLVSTAVFCIFIGTYLAIVNSVYGWDSLAASFQFTNNHITSIAPLTSGQAQALTVAVGFIGLTASVSLGMLVSARCRTAMVSVVVGLLLCLLPTILSMAGSGNLIQWLCCLLPAGGFGILHSFYYELLGNTFLLAGPFSVWSPYVIAIAAAVEIPFFFFLAARSYCQHEG